MHEGFLPTVRQRLLEQLLLAPEVVVDRGNVGPRLCGNASRGNRGDANFLDTRDGGHDQTRFGIVGGAAGSGVSSHLWDGTVSELTGNPLENPLRGQREGTNLHVELRRVGSREQQIVLGGPQ